MVCSRKAKHSSEEEPAAEDLDDHRARLEWIGVGGVASGEFKLIGDGVVLFESNLATRQEGQGLA